ncbi:MAG: hypothetical protein ACR2O4_07925, partial [Hyphomicrobiaceae bacterium]
MAPWISLTLMVLAGLGLVLRHDMISVVGFDVGIASAIAGIAGLLLFTGRRHGAEHPGGDDRTSSERFRQPAIVAVLAVLLFTGYTFSGPSVAWLTGAPSDAATVTSAPQKTARPSGRVALRLRRQPSGIFTTRSRINGTSTPIKI